MAAMPQHWWGTASHEVPLKELPGFQPDRMDHHSHSLLSVVTLHYLGTPDSHGRCVCMRLLSSVLETCGFPPPTQWHWYPWARQTMRIIASSACLLLLSCIQPYLSNHSALKELVTFSAPSQCPLNALSWFKDFSQYLEDQLDTTVENVMIFIIWHWEAKSPCSWSVFSLSGHGFCNRNGGGDTTGHEPQLKDQCVLEL